MLGVSSPLLQHPEIAMSITSGSAKMRFSEAEIVSLVVVS